MIIIEYLRCWHGICGKSPIFRNLGKIPEETAHVLQNLVSAKGLKYSIVSSSSSPLCLFGAGVPSFPSPRSPVMCFFYLDLFLLHVFSYNITPPQFRSSSFGVHPFPSSMFSSLHLLQSFSPRVLTISLSLILIPHLCLLPFLHS